MTSFAILASVPPTSAYAQTTSATPSRAVCQAISGTASPSSAQKSAWSSRPCADGRERPHRARELEPEDPRRELGQPLEVPVDLGDPHRDLVAEGDGERLLPVGPPGLDRVPVAPGERREQAAPRRDRGSRWRGSRSWRTSPVSRMSWVVAPQWMNSAASGSQTRARHRISGMIGCRASSRSRFISPRSRSSTRALSVISAAVASG